MLPVWPAGQQAGGGPSVIVQLLPQDQAHIGAAGPGVKDVHVPHAILVLPYKCIFRPNLNLG